MWKIKKKWKFIIISFLKRKPPLTDWKISFIIFFFFIQSILYMSIYAHTNSNHIVVFIFISLHVSYSLLNKIEILLYVPTVLSFALSVSTFSVSYFVSYIMYLPFFFNWFFMKKIWNKVISVYSSCSFWILCYVFWYLSYSGLLKTINSFYKNFFIIGGDF